MVALDRSASKPPQVESPAVLLVESETDLARFESLVAKEAPWLAIYLLKNDQPPDGVASSAEVFALLPRRAPAVTLGHAIERAFESLAAIEERRWETYELRRATADLASLNQIGITLSAERDIQALFDLILSKSRELTGADAGSLYRVEQDSRGTRSLVFVHAQNDSLAVPFRRSVLAFDSRSLAGYTAVTGESLNIGDVYRLGRRPGPRFNPDFDRRTKYRTRSMLVVPMKNQQGEVIGVLQLINAKRRREVKLVSQEALDAEVIRFSPRSVELTKSLASQAAVALENNLLYRDIERQFRGFVGAAGKAIEARDPATFGHSERVAKLTLRLAEVVNLTRHAGVYLSPDEMRELEYAALLHDVGKVKVADHVLLKAKKLYPHQLDLIQQRFLFLRKSMEAASLEKKLQFVLRHGPQACQEGLARIEAERDHQMDILDDLLRIIETANEPGLLPDEISGRLSKILAAEGLDSALAVADWRPPIRTAAGRKISSDSLSAIASGRTEALPFPGFIPPDSAHDATRPPLTSEEVRLLTIPRGTLDDEERTEIESHVVHSFNFLRQIPWTKELRNVPEIARAHHEKLDGSGYPDHLKGAAIPIQARMMTISDIYDALTAADRPYRPAVSPQRALAIIESEAKSNLLDPGLFALFRDSKVYEVTATES